MRVGDITRDPLPRADAILCRDCLVHLSFVNIARAVAKFRASGATWLTTTIFAGVDRNVACDDGWADRMLGVWRLDTPPQPHATAGQAEQGS